MNHVLIAIEQYIQKRLDAVNQDLVRVIMVKHDRRADRMLVIYEFYVRGSLGYDGYDEMSVSIEQIMIDSLNIAIDSGGEQCRQR